MVERVEALVDVLEQEAQQPAVDPKDIAGLPRALEILGEITDSSNEEKTIPLLDRFMKKYPNRDVQKAAREALVAIGMKPLRDSEKSHHFPLHIRMALKEKLKTRVAEMSLRGERSEYGDEAISSLSPADIADLVDRKGFAQWAKDKGISKAPPAVLREVSAALHEILGQDKRISPRKVDALLEFHERLHILFSAQPEIITKLFLALKEALGPDSFRLLRKEFQNNYGPAANEMEFVEELMVTYLQEKLFFDNPVRLVPDSLLEMQAGAIKARRKELDPAIGEILDNASRPLWGTVRGQAYASALRREFLMARGLRDPAFLNSPDPVKALLAFLKNPDRLANATDRATILCEMGEQLGAIGDARALESMGKHAAAEMDTPLRRRWLDAIGELGDPLTNCTQASQGEVLHNLSAP